MKNKFAISEVSQWRPAAEKFDVIIVENTMDPRCAHLANDCVTQDARKFASSSKDVPLQPELSQLAFELYTCVDGKDYGFTKQITNVLTNIANVSDAVPRIFIDISCMPRRRMAGLLAALLRFGSTRSIEVCIGYALANYIDPALDIAKPNERVQPVHPKFAGWTLVPSRPPAAIVGLGYEKGKALGAIELLQVPEVWAFLPNSPIESYRKELEQSNSDFLSLLDPERRLDYQVLDVNSTYSNLYSLTSTVSAKRNLVMFPFGPKIFTFISLLVAAQIPSVGVWYVSGEETAEQVQRSASGYVTGLTFKILPV